VPTFLRDLRVCPSIRVVSDQVGSPTWSTSLAEATAAILDALRSDDGFRLEPSDTGVYHLGGSGAATRVEIAHHVLAVLRARASAHHSAPVVIPILASEFAAPAQRPRYSALANRRVEQRFGVRLASWRDELARMLATIDFDRIASC
jgi:dTDP-4-dehydrorhamnose reductase